MMWRVKYRSATGVDFEHFVGETREEVEQAFADLLLEEEEFGSIITCEPVEAGL